MVVPQKAPFFPSGFACFSSLVTRHRSFDPGLQTLFCVTRHSPLVTVLLTSDPGLRTSDRLSRHSPLVTVLPTVGFS
jgi:hypothetical protein